MSALPIILTRGLLYALAGVQCWLAWSFWQSYAGEGEVKWLLPVFGVALALIEVFALVVAASADSQGRKSRATLWRGVWALLFVVNFAAEIGAFANVLAAEEDRRGSEITAVERLIAERDEQRALIATLTTELQSRRADKPIAALEVEIAAAREIAASFSPPRPRDAREIARLESALISASSRAAAETERDRLEAAIAAHHGPTSAHHPQIETLTLLTRRAGLNVTPDDVEAFIPLGLAIVIKLVLTFGFWVTTLDANPKPQAAPKPPQPQPEPGPAKPAPPEVVVAQAPPKRRRRKTRDLGKPILTDGAEPWGFLLDEPPADNKPN